MLRVLLVGVVLAACLMGCSCKTDVSFESMPDGDNERKVVEASRWQEVDVGEFTLSLPPGWKHEEGAGIDSKVGTFKGDGVVLLYDLGMYSWRIEVDEATVEYVTISGKEAKLVVGGKKSVAGVYFPEAVILKEENGEPFITLRLSVYGKDLTYDQQKLVVQILKTIKFKE